jgi:hypothetical protein
LPRRRRLSARGNRRQQNTRVPKRLALPQPTTANRIENENEVLEEGTPRSSHARTCSRTCDPTACRREGPREVDQLIDGDIRLLCDALGRERFEGLE